MPESLARRLAQMWERGERPELGEFLATETPSLGDFFDILLQDQKLRWQFGAGVPAEHYLARWPNLAQNPDRVVDLIYAEFVLRERNGENPTSEEYENRFPDWAELLRKQFEVHRALRSTSNEPNRASPSTIDAQAPATHKQSPPPRLAAYEIHEICGEGGMGQVYRARHKALDRIVAVKVIRAAHTENDQAVNRFLRECRAVGRLTHPNVIAVHDAGCENGVCFLAMEYLEGTDLHQFVRNQGPWPSFRACAALREAALGLHHAHERGLVHRDIKPANLFLTATEGRIKVLDFGLASLRATTADSETPLTVAGQFVGTPDYAAPELIDADRPVDRRTDIYSLGCTAYTILSGKPPFPGGNILDKLLKQRSEMPKPLASRGCQLPAGLDAVLSRMLAKDPAARYATCAEVAAALEPFCAEPIVARPKTARRSWLIVGGVLATSLIIALFVFTQLMPERKEGQLADRKWADPSAFNEKAVPISGKPGPVVNAASGGRSVLLTSSNGEVAHRDGVESVAFFSTGDRAVSSGLDGVVREWDVAAGRETASFPSRDGRFVAISGDGNSIATAGLGRIQIFDGSGALKRAIAADSLRLSCIALTSDARFLATAEMEPPATLLIWDLNAEKSLVRIGDLNEPVYAAAFSPKGDRLLFGGGGFWIGDQWKGLDFDIRVWDMALRKERQRWKGHTNTVSALAFAFDGRTALSGGKDRSLRLWDADTGEELARRNVAHEDGVRCAALTPDGRFAVTGGIDGRVKLWSLPIGPGGDPRRGPIAEVAGFPQDRHANIATTVAVSPDGRFAVSGSRDGTLRRWPLAQP